MTRLCISTFVFMALILSSSLPAAEKPVHPRPKIGLVLGGGGAKAGTQLGVLKVMEELRIPVDFVVGTSMGSFIGALYAMGYPLADIERILIETDWAWVFTAEIDRNDRPNRRKQDEYSFLIKKKIGLRDGKMKIGKGIVETQNLRTFLRELSLHVAHLKNFNDFPLPYRAISVDLADGSEVILDHGEIPDAVRSSMSLPGIFPPVVIEGRHLVDGGPADNLPIHVAKDAGMDRVIAIDVGADFYKVEEIESFFAVVDQLTMFLTRGNVAKSYALAGPNDVILRPDLTGLTTESYEKMDLAFPRGEKVARENLEKLRTFSVSEAEYAAFRQKRERPNRLPPKIDSVQAKTDSELSNKVVRRAFRAKAEETLDVAKARKDVGSLYATDYFSSVEYDVNEADGKKELMLTARENPDLKDFLRFGLRLYTDLNGDNTFGIGLNYTRTQLNSLAAEWRNEVQAGDTVEWISEYYQPIDPTLHLFLAPEVRVGRELLNVYGGGNSLTAQGVESYLRTGISVGYHISNVAELRTGYAYQLADADDRIGTTGASPDTFQTNRYFIRLKLDTLDNVNIPRRGQWGEVAWEHAPSGFGSEYVFQKLYGRWVGFATQCQNTFSVSLEVDTRFGNSLPATELYSLGGFLRLSGSSRNSLLGQRAALGRLLFYHLLGEKRRAIKSVPVYLGLSAEVGNSWPQGVDVSTDNTIVAGSGFVALDTFIGPIILGGGYNSEDQRSAYLQIGRWF